MMDAIGGSQEICPGGQLRICGGRVPLTAPRACDVLCAELNDPTVGGATLVIAKSLHQILLSLFIRERMGGSTI